MILRSGTTVFALITALAASAAYHVESVPYPPEMRGGVSGVAFAPHGSLVVTTRMGEVWRRDASTGQWRRFAWGLNEPLGVHAESDTAVVVAHKPELLRLVDTNADGEADTFSVLNDDWGVTQNYHELFFGLRRTAAGEYLGALSLASGGERDALQPSDVRGRIDTADPLVRTAHHAPVPWRGWAVKITAEGRLVPLAAGLRQPNGIGLSPDGAFFVTDNQGDWKPTCGLIHVEEGDFLGHPAGLKWGPAYDPSALTAEALWRRYKAPAVVFPHGPAGVSAGEPVWDQTGGRFGPFSGQVFVGDFSSMILRVSLEQVAGAWQGAVYPFLGRADLPGTVTGVRLAAGNTRLAFAPDGSLYTGQTGGWGGGSDGLQRISWDGVAAPEMKDVTLTRNGFRVRFTEPMDPATLTAANFQFTRFRLYYHSDYGSPWVDEAPVSVQAVEVAAGGREAVLTLSELAVGFVYELSVPALRTVMGAPLANPLAYYTANRLHSGEVAVGGTTRLPRPDEGAANVKDMQGGRLTGEALVAAGETVYKLYCLACHQADGRGLPGGAANFVDDPTRLAKTDEELLAVIARGNEAKGMPAFGAFIGPGQRRAALAYIRAKFGAPAP